MHSDAYKAWHTKHGHKEPDHFEHGSIDDIKKHLKPLEVRNWKLQGNKLVGETDAGNIVNMIPSNYILRGTDDEGMPVLEKISV